MDTNIQPKISVIIPVYNAQEFLKEALDSVLAQSFTDFEVLCVDDCSTDESWSILEEYAQKDERIKVFRNEKNLRLPGNLNKLLSLVNPNVEYIVRMDNDDICVPERFQIQYDFMQANKDVDVCGAWIEHFGDKQKVIVHPEEHNDIARALQDGCVLAHPTIIMRKSFIDKHNIQYDTDYLLEDYELWARCLIEYDAKFANIQQVLLKYRVHGNQISAARKNIIFLENEKIKSYIFKNLSLKEKIRRLMIFNNLRKAILQIRIGRRHFILRVFGYYLIKI